MSKTPISMLQELMVQRKESLPDYYIENCDEFGSPFKCTVKVGSMKAVGYASTKKDAKQNSAKKALEILGFSMGFNNSVEPKLQTTIIVQNLARQAAHITNYVGKLNEFASSNGKPYPTYRDEAVPGLNPTFLTTCNFLEYVSTGYGLKKKDAKQDAARNMLESLRDKDITLITLAVQNLHVEKEKRVETLTLEIKKRYEKLNSNGNNVKSAPNAFISIPDIKQKVFSMDDFEKELKNRGYKYKIETYQKSPRIMMLKICDTDATIMGKGETKEEALNDLFENAVLMFNHGFSLVPEF